MGVRVVIMHARKFKSQTKRPANKGCAEHDRVTQEITAETTGHLRRQGGGTQMVATRTPTLNPGRDDRSHAATFPVAEQERVPPVRHGPPSVNIELAIRDHPQGWAGG